MKVIAVDMDSILADFYFGVLEMYERESGYPAPVDVLNSWNSKLPNGKSVYDYFSQPGFFRRLAPIKGAREFMRQAQQAGHDVLLVTAFSSLTHAPTEKLQWLQEHMPDFHFDQVIFTKRKDRIIADVLIDDHAPNTKAFLEAQPRATAIGIQYPYNLIAPNAFTHLVPSYLDFEGAWARIGQLVLG